MARGRARRVQMPKASELNTRKLRMETSDTENAIEVIQFGARRDDQQSRPLYFCKKYLQGLEGRESISFINPDDKSGYNRRYKDRL